MKHLPLLALSALIALAANAFALDAPANFIVFDAPKPSPELTIGDGDGKSGALADFHGKFVLLNIWATWCVPCRKEMPTLDRLQGELGGPGFEVVALSIDRAGADAVRKFFADVGIQHLAVSIDAAAEAPFKLAAVGLPTTLLVNPHGEEIGRLIGPTDWDSPEMVGFLKSIVAPAGAESSTPSKKENPT